MSAVDGILLGLAFLVFIYLGVIIFKPGWF